MPIGSKLIISYPFCPCSCSNPICSNYKKGSMVAQSINFKQALRMLLKFQNGFNDECDLIKPLCKFCIN